MLDFGPLSAEADADLLSYFHLTNQAKTFVAFGPNRGPFIVIARPGGGKTALRKWLQAKASTDLTIAVASEKTRLSLENGDEPNAGDLRLLTTSELLTAIASEAVERDVASGKLKTDIKKSIDRWQNDVGGFFKQRFGGVSILGCGFTLKPSERRQYLQQVRQSGRLEVVAEEIKKLASAKRVLLVVDNPEEIVGAGMNDVTPENGVRVGAFLSVLAQVHRLGINVICFLKEQVFQVVRDEYADTSHFSDQVTGLAWSAEDLLDLLNTRVAARLGRTWSEVFAMDREKFAQQVFPFLSNGPRDLLMLCNLAGRRSDRLTKEDLLTGVDVLRSDRLKDLSAQYRQWPKFNVLTGALITVLREKYKSGRIPRGGINTVFGEQYSKPKTTIHDLRKLDWIDRARWEAPPMDERLFVAGIVGYLDENGTTVYPWSGRDVTEFQSAKSHFISPIFAAPPRVGAS